MTGEIAQCVKYLLCKHKDVSSDPQHSCQIWGQSHVTIASYARTLETGRSWRNIG